MSDEESAIVERAVEFAKANKKAIAKELTDKSTFPPDDLPVSIFMAGSPGAGKTETLRSLIKEITTDEKSVIRIDTDDLRSVFKEYNGINSSLFMASTSILAEKIQDMALENKQSFFFDGTFSHLDKARQNIERSLHRGRLVQIVYVYQEPIQAWKFVQAREQKDGRTIPREAFIEQYFAARKNVNALKKEFGNAIRVDLVIKNMEGTDVEYHRNVDVIDNYISEKYTQDDLEALINL
ncbi:zeta toxin family protein [Mucilaginibacter gossypii]|uniref:zeta toxin family protein n=1 Tax=Mucilaginibacter gossypii TaxID=551996 RepID=UPI000DCDDCB2|nr:MULTISPECIES: zeta toxin family protein [Mucilaginibacter]QTE35883.1 zeta toxin family protein [Mucilaginibacter gossypii]RAV54688.1 Zeta toxin [Mucilaginibacter rubeus]